MGSPTIFSGRRTRTLTADGLILAAGSKVDFDGVVNYVTNGHAEVNTLGWATYADAAGPAPVDGTGGSPQAGLFTRSTTTPLRGLASFLLDKTGAANRQGQGSSYDFIIDETDRAKRFPISFDYVPSGTYADDDVTVWIYDVTNAALIQPAGFQIKNAGIASRQVATFQTTSNSSSYRLIFHVSSVSTANYALKIDNVQIGPQNVTFSTPVTDWISYTPTGGFTNTTYSGRYRRVGDSMEVQAFMALTGTPTGAFNVSIPAGFTIDTAKITNGGTSNVYGIVIGADTGVNNYTGSAVALDSTTVRVIADGSGTSLWSTTIPFTWGNTDNASFRFTVPIVGWSASAQVVSDSSEGRVVAASYSVLSSTTLTSGTAIKYTSLKYDTHAAYNTSTGQYTVKVPGVYRVTLGGTYVGSGTNDISLYLNGSNSLANFGTLISTGRVANAVSVKCVAGDIITIVPGSSANNAGSTDGFFSIEMVQGSQTLLGGETVGCRYTTGATQAIGTATIVDFETRTYDSHLAVTTGASWRFTAPVSGLYSVKSRFLTAGSTLAQRFTYDIFKSGVTTNANVVSHQKETTNSSRHNAAGGDTIRLLAGEFIDLRGSATGATTNLSGDTSFNFIAIERVGNY